MDEKRRFMRFNVLMDAVCKKGDSLKRRIKVNNFSKEGVGLVGGKEFKKGEELEIEMLIPGDNVPVLFEGEITWTKGPASDSAEHKSGIKFKKINNHDKSRILEYIYQHWIKPGE